MSDIKKCWYVVCVVSGKEKKVKEYLDFEIFCLKLQDYVFQVLIFIEKVFQICNGKKISKECVYFLGYVLIEVFFIGEVFYVIKGILNVFGFLGVEKGGDLQLMCLFEVN